MSAADIWRQRLRADLVAAMKARDPVAVAALRSAISAIDNAEAVAVPDGGAPALAGAIAGAAAGVGSTEVARRDLAPDEVRGVVQMLIDDWEGAAAWSRGHGLPERAERLGREAAVLRAFVAGISDMA